MTCRDVCTISNQTKSKQHGTRLFLCVCVLGEGGGLRGAILSSFGNIEIHSVHLNFSELWAQKFIPLTNQYYVICHVRSLVYRLAQSNLSVTENVSVSLLLGLQKIILFHMFPKTNIIITQCNKLGPSYFYIYQDDQSGYADLNSLPCVNSSWSMILSFVRSRRAKSTHICYVGILTYIKYTVRL